MSIKTKILAPFLAIVLVATLIAGFIDFCGQRIHEETATLASNAILAGDMSWKADDDFDKLGDLVTEVSAMTHFVEAGVIEQRLREGAGAEETDLIGLKAAALSPEMEALAQKAIERFHEWRGHAEVLAGLRRAKDIATVEVMNRETQGVKAMLKGARAMAGHDARARIAEASISAQAQAAGLLLLVAGLAMAGIAVAFWLARNLSLPLGHLVANAEKLAGGDVSITFSTSARNDEIGEISRAVAHFRDNVLSAQSAEANAGAQAHLETERLSKENLLLNNLDSLTGLPNRRQFFTTMHELLRRPTRDGQRFVLGLIDLDGFKSINDLYGHVVGDKVLIEASRRLRTVCDISIFLARLGGDEFGVIVDADLSDADIQEFGVLMCQALDASFVLPGIVVALSGSVGFAAFPQAGSTPEKLFERADYALYNAKQHQRGRAVIFSIEHETEFRQSVILERCLRQANLESEFSIYFQPIVDVERRKIIAFEALARWDSPTLGRVAPDVFIRIAERSDLINKLTRMLLRKALAKARTWPSHIRVSFNLSARDLASQEAILNLVTIIENSGIKPGQIDLEVTETALVQNLEQTNVSLRSLRALGVGISLDDFGTGYSNLSYLRRFPIDKIKIDRSFIKDVEMDPSCRAIVKSVIDLCRDLKLTCIVEGMETVGQARVLRALGCATMQGYFFGKPMPAAEVLGFLDAANSPLQLEAPEIQAMAS